MRRRHALAQVRLQRRRVRRCRTGLEFDDHAGHLTQARVRDARGCGRRHRRMLQQRTLDGFRQHLEAAAHDRAVRATAMEQEAVPVDQRDVRGADPLRPDARRHHFENAFAIRRQHLAAVGIDHPQLGAGQRAAHAAELLRAPLGVQVERHRRDRPAELGGAVAQQDGDAVARLEGALHGRVQRRGAGAQAADAGQVLARDVCVQHHLHAGRRQARGGRTVAPHVVVPAGHAELVEQHDALVLQQRRDGRVDAGDVTEREVQQRRNLGGQIGHRADVMLENQLVAHRERLGLAGGAAGQDLDARRLRCPLRTHRLWPLPARPQAVEHDDADVLPAQHRAQRVVQVFGVQHHRSGLHLLQIARDRRCGLEGVDHADRPPRREQAQQRCERRRAVARHEGDRRAGADAMGVERSVQPVRDLAHRAPVDPAVLVLHGRLRTRSRQCLHGAFGQPLVRGARPGLAPGARLSGGHGVPHASGPPPCLTGRRRAPGSCPPRSARPPTPSARSNPPDRCRSARRPCSATARR